jgi:hypothetical protein
VNTFKADGSTFTYKGPQGDAETTASVEGNKVIMVSKGTDATPDEGITTERYVEGGKLFQVITHQKSGKEWRRQCKKVD